MVTDLLLFRLPVNTNLEKKQSKALLPAPLPVGIKRSFLVLKETKGLPLPRNSMLILSTAPFC